MAGLKSAFVPVSVLPAPGAAVIEIHLGAAVRLRVPAAVSARWLGEVLHQLMV